MIVLKVNGREFKHFQNIEVSLGIDTIASTFNFNGFFDIDNEELKKIFRPFAFNKCQVWYIDEDRGIKERLITGITLNTGLSTQSQIRLTSLSGYSQTGIFETVNIPIDLYPLQIDGLGLDKIAKKFCDYFNIPLYIYDNAKEDCAKILDKVKAEPKQTIKDFLSKIASDRNITITHDNLGQLVLYKILDKTPPKISIDEDDDYVISVSINPNGQGMHNPITVLKQASTDSQNEGITTINSPFIDFVMPLVDVLENGGEIDTTKKANAIACREAKNFPITIELQGWSFNNKIVRAGFYIELTAKSIFLNTTKLVLQRVTFKSDPEKGETLTLEAVMPCVYTGELPSKNPFV